MASELVAYASDFLIRCRSLHVACIFVALTLPLELVFF